MKKNELLPAEAAARALNEGRRLRDQNRLDAAIDCFARVPREAGEAYVEAQLGWLLADFARFDVGAAAERLGVLLSEFPDHPAVLSEAGLVLPLSGDPLKAWACLCRLVAEGHARPCDRYQLACVAANCGMLDIARAELFEALSKDPSECLSSVFDGDLAAVWAALAEPSEAEAHALRGPMFERMEQDALDAVRRIKINMADAVKLPPHLRGMLRRVPGSWSYEFREEFVVLDPANAHRLHDVWEQLARERLAAFARARTRAFLAVLDLQHDYAREALARDNVLAARWHVFHLLRHDPARLPELLGDAALAPLRPLLREIEAAFAVHPGVLDDRFRVIDEQELIEAKRAADAPGDLPGGLWVWRYAMLCDHLGDRERAIPLFFELCRRWPDDACGYVNLSNSLAHLGRWDDAAAALSAAPKWYFGTPHAESHVARIEARDISAPMFDLAPFRGQPDLGGLLPELSLSIP